MISKERLDEFKKIFKEQFGRDISDEKAREVGQGIVNYFDLLGKIYHRIKTEKKDK